MRCTFYLCCFVFLLYVIPDYSDDGRYFRKQLVYYSADRTRENIVNEEEAGMR